MHIAVDARLNAYRVGGIAQYTQQLTQAMVSLAPQHHFTILAHRKQQQAVVQGANVRVRRCWTPPHNRWEQITLPIELLPVRSDVLHSPDFIPPLRYQGSVVITVHDLAFVRYPEILDDQARHFYGQINAAVERANAIIAVSQSTKADIIDLLGVASERIEVVYEAAAPHFRPLELAINETRSFNEQTVKSGDFVLFVGTLEPRKNLTTLLDAIAVCRDRQPHNVPRLVVAGGRGWLDEPIFHHVRERRLADFVQFIGSVDQQALLWLYNACRFYVNPELYSGFGLPVLEGMQCGAPVVAANTSALPEVVGEAGLLVAPQDVDAWATTLSHLWQDDALRADLRERGLAQAQRFTWQQAARETLDIYRRVCK